jgi:DNA-binding CsgD family transcriptional regulator
MLAAGKVDKQICAVLAISNPTLRVAINRAKQHLGARTRCQAVVLYAKNCEDDDGYL